MTTIIPLKEVLIIKSIELNQRDNSLNLLRLIFASFVLIGHSFGMIYAENNLPSTVNYIISLAVPCFFVVSGYLITASALKNNFKKFLTKRFARIYPAYFCMLIAIVIFFAPLAYDICNGGQIVLLNYIKQEPSPIRFVIFGLPLFLFSPTIGQTLIHSSSPYWNGSAWTLIFEFACYITISLLMFGLSKFKVKKPVKIISIFYLILVVISFFYPRPEGIPTRDIYNLFVFMVNLLSIFLGGSIVYLIKNKLHFSPKYLLAAILICVLLMSLLPY